MINIFYGSEREYGNCEPSDTIGEVASYTHYTAYELCDIIDGIVKGRLQAVKVTESEVDNDASTKES